MNFLKRVLDKVKRRMSQADLEKKINDATANQTGYTSISFLNEISSRTGNTNECKFISNYCIKLLGLKLRSSKRLLRSLG